MPYLEAILYEVQTALGMIVVVGTNEVRGIRIVGFHFSKGTLVALNLAKLHDDKWEKPESEKFKSKEFLEYGLEKTQWIFSFLCWKKRLCWSSTSQDNDVHVHIVRMTINYACCCLERLRYTEIH